MASVSTVEPSTEDSPLTGAERQALIDILDQFLTIGASRSLVPMAEVQDLALDMRLILRPVAQPAG